MATAARPLPPMQQRFVEEYLVDLNATQAAIRAGYSAKTAEVQGPRLLGNVRVAEAVAKGKADRAATTKVTADGVLEELSALHRSKITHYKINQQTGALELTEDAPPNAMAAVKSFESEPIYPAFGGALLGYKGKIQLWDKPGMVKLAGRHVGMKGFFDKLEVTGANGKDLIPSREGAIDDLRAILSPKSTAVTPAPPPAEGG